MQHHPIFDRFEHAPSVATGRHLFDFLGTRTRVTFRRGWEKFTTPEGTPMRPKLPPVNEHYFDWIATLTAVSRCSGTFRMAELGAGWAPWLVRAAFAAAQNRAITNLELIAVEADPTHHRWAVEHFADNGIDNEQYQVLFGAVSGQPGTLRFPVIDNPDEDYGASLRAAESNIPYIEVPAYSIGDLLERFSGPIDFMHVDIQGAEYDALPTAIHHLNRGVKSIMVGTHLANEKHDWLVDVFRTAGWTEVMNYPRNTLSVTEFGEVQFGDGFLLFDNPAVS